MEEWDGVAFGHKGKENHMVWLWITTDRTHFLFLSSSFSSPQIFLSIFLACSLSSQYVLFGVGGGWFFFFFWKKWWMIFINEPSGRIIYVRLMQSQIFYMVAVRSKDTLLTLWACDKQNIMRWLIFFYIWQNLSTLI